GQNVRRLLHKAVIEDHIADEDLERARVLLFIHKKVHSHFRLRYFNPLFKPQRAKPLKEENEALHWKYHYALEVSGRIFDFDFDGSFGLNLETYAQLMFGENIRNIDTILLSAKEY